MLFWVKFAMHVYFVFCVYQPDDAIIQYKYPNRVYLIARPNYALEFLAGKENNFFYKKVPIYEVYSTISMNRAPLFHCKHKHIMKSGAPPDKFGVMPHLVPIQFPGFRSRIDCLMSGHEG